MNNERIKARATFRFENFRDSDRIQSTCRESVDGLRRQCNDVALAQQFNRRIAVG
jgi:hypothetical protein